jgi:hypothetical protein
MIADPLTQGALRDPGLHSGTALRFAFVRIFSFRERQSWFCTPAERQGRSKQKPRVAQRTLGPDSATKPNPDGQRR